MSEPVKCGWCGHVGIPILSMYGATLCQFICKCGHQLSVPEPKELSQKYNSLRHQLTEAQRELRQYPFTIEYSKHFEEKIVPYIDRAEKAEQESSTFHNSWLLTEKKVVKLNKENKRLLSVINRYKQAREYEIANSLAHVNPLLETEKALFKEVE